MISTGVFLHAGVGNGLVTNAPVRMHNDSFQRPALRVARRLRRSCASYGSGGGPWLMRGMPSGGDVLDGITQAAYRALVSCRTENPQPISSDSATRGRRFRTR